MHVTASAGIALWAAIMLPLSPHTLRAQEDAPASPAVTSQPSTQPAAGHLLWRLETGG